MMKITRKKEIICESPDIIQLITEWTQNENWKFADFAEFLKLIGVKTPVKLSDYNGESFKCITALNEEIRIELFFGDGIDFFSKIQVQTADELCRYETNENIGSSVPAVDLRKRDVVKDGKKLENYYSRYFCHRTLEFDKNHQLKIKFDEPEKNSDQKEISVLRNRKEVEAYLLSLDKETLVIEKVFNKLIDLLKLSKEDISKCDEILISYMENIEGNLWVVRQKISMEHGKCIEYAILENGETYHVFDDGCWKFLSDNGIRVFYQEDRKEYLMSIRGDEENIKGVNPKEIMERVKEKIEKMWEFVK